MTKANPPSNSALAIFSGPCLPLAALGLPLVVHLPTYYARDIGLPLGAVGMAFLLVRLVDIFFDPVLGVLMDRSKTPLGHFRPWLLGSIPVLMAGSWMLFMARPGVSQLYLWAWLLVAYLGFSMGSLSQQAWASVLSPDYDQRSRIYGWWQAGNVAGILLVLLLPPLVTAVLHGSRAEGVQAMGWFIVVLTPLTIALAVWRVGEPPPQGAHRAPRLSDYLGLLGNASIRRLMLADLLLGWAPGITGALFLFYFDQVKKVPETEANLLLLVYFIAAFVGAPVWSFLALKIGKHRALAVNSLFVVASLFAVLIIPFSSFLVACAVMAAVGLPYSGGSLLLRAMLADVGDEMRLDSGVDRTGLLYAVLTGTTKIGYALATATFVILEWLGFKATAAHNTASSLIGLQVLFVGLPSVLALLAAWIILRYRLDAGRHAEIRSALARQDAARA
jgi:GPH family glycoside/pentoside/hexuronide:cation symporter